MAGVSGGLGREGGEVGALSIDGAVRGSAADGPCINCLIRSTIDGSKLARALSLTSSSQR